jgi:shikimate dehydrogenase
MLRFAVLGDPVEHSKSPRMHAAAYAALGMPHVYEQLRTTPAALGERVAKLRAGDFAGLNVTVPLKREVLSHVDRVEPFAMLVGAANTLVRGAVGEVVAYNTDVPALVEEIRAIARPDAANGVGLVLGTGGAARAAVVALASLGFKKIAVRGRTDADGFARGMQKALATSSGLAGAVVEAEPLAPREGTEPRVSVVVQATSAGMTGASPGEPLAGAVAWAKLPTSAAAIDVVYAPPETPFLRAARARGLSAKNGLGMLARQGALAFALWLGVPPPYDVMLAALEAP